MISAGIGIGIDMGMSIDIYINMCVTDGIGINISVSINIGIIMNKNNSTNRNAKMCISISNTIRICVSTSTSMSMSMCIYLSNGLSIASTCSFILLIVFAALSGLSLVIAFILGWVFQCVLWIHIVINTLRRRLAISCLPSQCKEHCWHDFVTLLFLLAGEAVVNDWSIPVTKNKSKETKHIK